ncbi:zinc finger protein 512B isoform X2 [Ascaphus truei]|uniref:zinc finger protein 512B isoform X2 n=1 Tax=Ascaphus truei TaxID=8439 RepID=UPI003F5A7B19
MTRKLRRPRQTWLIHSLPDPGDTSPGPVNPDLCHTSPSPSPRLVQPATPPNWATLLSQWKEKFKSGSRVRCPSSGCWLEFPSIYSLKYHYQRCQGAALSSRLLFACGCCEAAFASKSQLEKHLVWNHSDRGSSREKRPPNPAARSGGQKRAGQSIFSPHRHSKQAKLRKPPENGECSPQFGDAPGSSECSPHSRSVKQGGARLSDEDPGRMRHRRKQKTPKKFTGEQPSITGTFGLKGLGKAEDKSRGRRGRIGGGRMQEMRGSGVRRENTAPPPGSVEDKWQHQISERGEVTCPNCASVTRKTMAGLRKHMSVCEQLQEALKCQHCRKQFKSKAGLNYHTMAEHANKCFSTDEAPLDEQKERERLRKVLKQMGKLRCPNKSCSASFSSLMGYQYHGQRCGRDPCERDRLHFPCPHCSKQYQSKAGRDYHVRSEHGTAPMEPELSAQGAEALEDFERTPSGRVRRRSAQVAVFHLQEIAEDELAKEGSRRRMREDLVPDSKRLNYLRPGLPTFNPQLLDSWKNRVKEDGFISCPNNYCEAIYSSVSGLKAHLANCNKGNHSVGKYRCLLCQKEFSSESGVKYHILKTHSQNWFRVPAIPPPPKRKLASESPSKESETVATGKKRGRKPNERPPATPPAPTAHPGHGKETPLILKTYSRKPTSPEPKGRPKKSAPPRRAK